MESRGRWLLEMDEPGHRVAALPPAVLVFMGSWTLQALFSPFVKGGK